MILICFHNCYFCIKQIHNMKNLTYLIVISFSAFIYSCGGGGSSSPAVSAAPAIGAEELDMTNATVSDYSSGGLQRVVKKDPKLGNVTSEGPILNGKKEGTWVVYYVAVSYTHLTLPTTPYV